MSCYVWGRHPPTSTVPSNIASNISDWTSQLFLFGFWNQLFSSLFWVDTSWSQPRGSQQELRWRTYQLQKHQRCTSCVRLLRIEIIQRLHYRSEQIAFFSCTKKLYSNETIINCCVTKVVTKGPKCFICVHQGPNVCWWFSLNLCSPHLDYMMHTIPVYTLPLVSSLEFLEFEKKKGNGNGSQPSNPILIIIL